MKTECVDGRLVIKWNPLKGVKEYFLQISSMEGEIIKTQEPKYTIKDIKPATEYIIFVWGENETSKGKIFEIKHQTRK